MLSRLQKDNNYKLIVKCLPSICDPDLKNKCLTTLLLRIPLNSHLICISTDDSVQEQTIQCPELVKLAVKSHEI